MQEKYDIHPDFKMLRYLHMPRSRLSMWTANLFMKLLYKCRKLPDGVKMHRLKLSMRDGYILNVDVFSNQDVKAKVPCLIYFPGGGFMMRATHIHKHNLVTMVKNLKITGIMVHYRLAPKYPFPLALYDCIDSFNYITENCEAMNIDSDRIGMGGDSAGGNLACGVALYNKDKIHKPLKMLLMIYPALDKGQETRSRKTYSNTPMLNSNIFGVVDKKYYRNGLFGSDKYTFPLTHPDVSGLKNVYIETAEYDPLHDDGIKFYKLLIKQNVTAELNDTSGTVHGYDVLLKSKIVQESMSKRIDFIERYL